MIEGAAILLAGVVLGWIGRGVRRGGSKSGQAICSCGDPRGKHIDGKGACQAEHKRSSNGIQEFRPCGCQMYDGPEPLPGYYAPEIQG